MSEIDCKPSTLDRIFDFLDYNGAKYKILIYPAICFLCIFSLYLWKGARGTIYGLTLIPLVYSLIIIIDYIIIKRSFYHFLQDAFYNVTVNYFTPYLIIIIWYYIYKYFLPNSEIHFSNRQEFYIKLIFAISATASTILQLSFLIKLVNLNRYIKFKLTNYFILFVLCYFTIGFNFSLLYLLQIDSLKYVLTNNKIWDTVYFSFVTLATTGYGDITPITNWSKTLIIIENFIGLFLTAYVIALIFTIKKK